MICFPNLQTERLWLRQTIEEDTEAVFSVFSDPKVAQFHNVDTFTQLNQATEVIERRTRGFIDGRGIRWAIARKLDNYVIGSCGLTWDKLMCIQVALNWC
jgi:ribosomal-protein-alanine N-acetyltransferase